MKVLAGGGSGLAGIAGLALTKGEMSVRFNCIGAEGFVASHGRGACS